MASNTEVLNALLGETSALTLSQVAAKMGLKPNQVNTVLSRLVAKELVDKNEQNEYTINEMGIQEVSPSTLESENLTPQKIFESYGKGIGISINLLPMISDYVFKGGKYTDMKWVYKALGDMNVPADKLNIWWNNWRVYCNQPVPEDMPDIEKPNSINASKQEREKQEEQRAEERIEWDIGADDLPINVGEMGGRLTHGEAVEIARYRAMTKARVASMPVASSPEEKVDPMAQFEKMVTLVKTYFQPDGDKVSKPLVVIPQEDGTFSFQEFDPSKPMVLGGARQQPQPGANWYISPDGSSRKVEPGEPVIINMGGNNNQQNHEQKESRTFLIHPDGSTEEWKPGMPIIIKQPQAQPAQQSTPMMINAQTPDGKPFVIDIESAFRWDDHMSKKRREEEAHELKMDVGRTFKNLASKGIKALDDMGGDDE